MAQQCEANTSESLKLYNEILAIKKLCENQENDMKNFDVTLSCLPVEVIILLKDFLNITFAMGIENVDQSNIELYFFEAIKERIEYLDIIKNLQLENRNLDEQINTELSEIQNIEDGKTEFLKSIIPLPKITNDIELLEKQIESIRGKQSQFSSTSLKCIDLLILKLDELELLKNSKESKPK